MRITNQMVTSGSLRNMQKSMQRVSKLNQQVTSGKKITAPSEDPVVAIRALKLRTTCGQLEQYKNKNIKDALSWLGTTQTSVENVFKNLEEVYRYCEQGAQDTFQTMDRQTIVNNLKAWKDSIYYEGGMTYAGRYLFSGYKTETNLRFQDETAKSGLSYEITENFSPNKIEVKRVVLNEINTSDLDSVLANPGSYESPVQESVYKLRLSYDDLKGDDITINITDADGNVIRSITPNIKTIAQTDEYYDVAAGEVNYIPETGELIFGEDIYNEIKDQPNISVTYNKEDFKVGDLRPEMYFDCVQHKEMPDGSIKDTNFVKDVDGQSIQYEVNFNQYITVNVEGNEFIFHEMGNRIDDLADAVQAVIDIENTIAKLKSLLEDPQYKDDTDAVDQINKMLEDADVELAMKRENMQKLFGNNITHFQNFMEQVSAVQAKVGATYAKVKMIEVRVEEQLANFEELKSVNEDVETEEAAMEMYQSELVYESALATTASVIKKTLLDYL